MPIDKKKFEYQLSRNMMTHKDLAQASGLSMATISGIRSGKIKRPKKKTMVALVNALKCSPEDLLEDPS